MIYEPIKIDRQNLSSRLFSSALTGKPARFQRLIFSKIKGVL